MVPNALQRDGYVFVHPGLEAALRGILGR
ncbi:MAG: hypothetical protein ACO36A_09075 [Ilumatobacteraceae bacterium]